MPRTGWLALGALASALVFALVLPATPPLVLGGLTVTGMAAIAAAVARRPRLAAMMVGCGAVAARLLVGGAGGQAVVAPPATSLDGRWTAEVVSLGSTTGGQQRSVLVVRAVDLAQADTGPAGPWRAYAWLPRYPALVQGDRITFHGRLDPIHRDGSEFTAYLEGIGASVTTRVSEIVLAGDSGSVLAIAGSARSAADGALARVLPEPMAGLASAVLVGRRDRVAREVTDAFTATGLSHVVAISGWNIALIGAVVGGTLAAAGIGRRTRTVAIVMVLAVFTLVAGGGASVVRAAFMGGVALIAREAGRPGSAAASLGLAVWMLLVLDPTMASDVGFQLSVAATAGLLAWGDRLMTRIAGHRPGRARRWLAGSLGVSLAAQAATLPLVLLHFGRLSLVSPLANLLVAPVVAPAMLVGSVCLVAGLVVAAGLPAVLVAPFAVLGWAVLGVMIAIADLFAALPYASVELPPALATGMAAVLAAITGWAAWRGRAVTPTNARHVPPPERPAPTPAPPRRTATIVLVAALGAVTLVAGAGALLGLAHGGGRLVVTALDVGQGDAILVEGPRGARVLLDSGPDPDRLLTVLDRHVPPWDRRIDLVILTHPHEDHVAGLAMLLARYRVAGIAENGMLGAGPGDAAFRGWLAATGVTTRRLAAGDRLALDDVRALVRWPIRGEVPARSPSEGRRVNDTSVVLDLRFGDRRLLLTGDIEDDVDPRLLASGIGDPGRRLDVLKVAHHGSGTATSEAWLDALRPRVALVSAGTGNPYGHPAPRTIERLAGHGARVLRTDLDGDLEVSTDGHDLRFATSGGRPRTAAGATSGGRPRTAAVTTPANASPTLASAGRFSALSAATPVSIGAFLCAIPLSAARLAAAAPAPAPHPPRGRAVMDPDRPDGGAPDAW